MDNTLIQIVLQQLLVQSPLLLAYLVGMILALVFLRRYPIPSLLTLIATGVSLAVTVSQTLLTQYFIQARQNNGWDLKTVGMFLTVVNLSSSVFRAAGIGLLVAAVFVRRRTP